MSTMSELEAMKLIDDSLSQFDDPATRDRILEWAWSKFSSQPTPTGSRKEDKKGKKTKKNKGKVKKATKPKFAISMVKDLDLNPSDKQTFADFVAEKKPSSNHEKSVSCVYYLQHILEKAPITSSHVFTCFKVMGWRLPSNLDNTLQWVASQKGWLDTRSMANIKVTTHGENLIEHDLPHKKGNN